MGFVRLNYVPKPYRVIDIDMIEMYRKRRTQTNRSITAFRFEWIA